MLWGDSPDVVVRYGVPEPAYTQPERHRYARCRGRDALASGGAGATLFTASGRAWGAGARRRFDRTHRAHACGDAASGAWHRSRRPLLL